MAQQQVHSNSDDDDEELKPFPPPGDQTRHGANNDPSRASEDDLLQEIDAVLEENAQEFVAAYIQKGGQ